MTRTFSDLIQARWDKGLFLCIGIDPVPEKIPQHLYTSRQGRVQKSLADVLWTFCKDIVLATAEYTAAYKPNAAFFERYGTDGLTVLQSLIRFINSVVPEVPVIYDAKRGDIGNTNIGYLHTCTEYLRADAITLSPYLGKEALAPFLDRREMGCLILARTSNPGAEEFQDLLLDGGDPLWLKVATHVATEWNHHGNCGLVFGATSPTEMARARSVVGDEVLILSPGIGAQGGNLEAAVRAARNKRGTGAIFNSSRDIIFAGSDHTFARAAAARAQDVSTQLRIAMQAT